MKLEMSAVLKAGGIGAAVILVLALLAQFLPVVGVVCCCLIWIAYAGAGVLYGFFAKKKAGTISGGPAALGGAISAAIGGVVRGIVTAIAALVVGTTAATEALYQLQAQGFDIPPEVFQMYTTPGFGVATALIGLCGAIIFAAILGAIGGAIYGATQKDKGTGVPAM